MKKLFNADWSLKLSSIEIGFFFVFGQLCCPSSSKSWCLLTEFLVEKFLELSIEDGEGEKVSAGLIIAKYFRKY